MENQMRRIINEPLFALLTGSPKWSYWRKMEHSQYLQRSDLQALQWERLREILKYAFERNQFYRNCFKESNLHPSDIKSPEDLKKIPILEKKEIQKDPKRLISSGYDPPSLLKFKTGGSTGRSIEIYLTEECSELRNAVARRHDRWTGWEVGEPIGAVWGNPKLPATLKDQMRSRLLCPTIYLDTMNMTDEAVKAFAREWKKVRPTLLFGHAHSLYVLAKYVRDLAISEIQPKGILSTSMMLLPHERKFMEEVFGVKIFDRYGCEEVSLIASECERHEGLHLNIEHLFIEFLKNDGTDVMPGEEGQIVVTDLMNKAMPFIRYRVEDVGTPSERTCSCGRGLPLMEKVTGRVADFLIREDGSRVAGVSIIENTLTRIPGVDQMQIIQEELGLIVLNIVPGANFNTRMEQELKNYFKGLFNLRVKVEVKRVKEIPAERSGKYRFSICKISS
jgi:phenylacetate-CoA ligase